MYCTPLNIEPNTIKKRDIYTNINEKYVINNADKFDTSKKSCEKILYIILFSYNSITK